VTQNLRQLGGPELASSAAAVRIGRQSDLVAHHSPPFLVTETAKSRQVTKNGGGLFWGHCRRRA
jgi:hypothetical protein